MFSQVPVTRWFIVLLCASGALRAALQASTDFHAHAVGGAAVEVLGTAALTLGALVYSLIKKVA